MPYQDVNGNPIAPAQNPYVVSGAAASVVNQEYRSQLVYTRFIKTYIPHDKM